MVSDGHGCQSEYRCIPTAVPCSLKETGDRHKNTKETKNKRPNTTVLQSHYTLRGVSLTAGINQNRQTLIMSHSLRILNSRMTDHCLQIRTAWEKKKKKKRIVPIWVENQAKKKKGKERKEERSIVI